MAVFYTQESLGQGERIVRFAQFHWMYNLWAATMLLWGAAGAALALAAAIYGYRTVGWCPPAAEVGWWGCMGALHWGVKLAVLGIFVMGLWSFAHLMVVRVSTEIAVTTRRLVYKIGLVSRDAEEMNIDRVESVNVEQGILGRILGYGRVIVRGMGVGQIVLPTIADPVVFRKAIQWARTYREDERDDNRRDSTS
jgi:uncharacterized membrane protein YdbT with pleckstrin-like domain